MSKNLKATNAKNPIYASEVGAAAATKATAAMPSKGTKFLIKPDLGKNNKKDLLKTMVYHDSTAMVFAKEVQSQMLTSMNPKSPSGRHDDSPQGPNQVVLSLEGAHHELDSATNKVYVQMQNQQQLLTNLKAAHQKSPPQYIAHAPAFVHQQQHQPHHVDIMPATSTVAVTPPPPPLAQQAQPPTALHHPSPAASPSSTSATTTTATTTTTTKRGGKSAAAKVQFKCELCGMTFGSKSAHTSHTKSHANKGEITSSGKLAAAGEGAGKELTQIKAISTAANGGGGGDPYQCNVCQKTFAVPARLIRHYRTHTGERPFECEFCHKLFSVKENLQVHRRIHTKERPYKCDVCGRAFEHSGKLHRHMRIHTGERPHKCSVCEKTFIQSGQLVIHMRTHTGEKPYKCPVEGCGKGFTCSKQLKVHSRTHTGEKPYHCDICFRDFGYNHVLKLHRVQHYGSKCYKCTICDETFKGKKEMEAHIKGHANDDGAEGAGSDGSNGAPVASSSSRSSPAPTVASPDSGNHIKSESIGGDLDVLDNAVASLLDSGKQDSLLPTSTQQFIGSSAQSPMSSAASPSSLSASYLSSMGSPALSGNSSTTTLGLDALDTNSYHGEAPKAMVFTAALRGKPPAAAGYVAEEMPTDLSVPQQQQEVKQLPTTTTTTNAQPNPPTYYEAEAEAAHYRMQENSLTDLQSVRNYHHVASNGMAYNGNGLSSQQQQQQQVQQPTINPALLEAASIASRSVLLESREHEATEAALQILQLNRSRTPGDMGHHSLIPSGLSAESSHYEDMYETNELISHYKRGDLAKHGLHKGYVPVPKFESSLHLDENIVRKVEAAIAPLRTSTESPERSSSPESDCMMMADRDIMTLPLRKRKIYMSEKDKMQATRHEEHGAPGNGEVADMAGICEMNTKAVRMSSVIQFAKAS